MSTARKVLMIIALVASIIAVIVYGICALVFFLAAGNEELLTKVLEGINKTDLSPDDGKKIVIIVGIVFIMLALVNLINAGLSGKGIKSSRAGLMVINIIFGVIAGIYINSLGGIFGLVDGKKDWL